MATQAQPIPEVPKMEVEKKQQASSYAGFMAGVASGCTKLAVGHPADTIKIRLQTSPRGTYRGVVHCFTNIVRTEGPRKLYAGASVPALGWAMTDSALMGSLQVYRGFLLKHGFGEDIPGMEEERERRAREKDRERVRKGKGKWKQVMPESEMMVAEDVLEEGDVSDPTRRLSLAGHALAGMGAGWTNAGIAHPIEKIKCALQNQRALSALALVSPLPSTPLPSLSTLSPSPHRTYSTLSIPLNSALTSSSASSLLATSPLSTAAAAARSRERFSNPWDVVKQTLKIQGYGGMWRGFGATLVFRSSFAFMFGGFELFNRLFQKLDNTPYALSKPAQNFLAGGLASNLYWLTALPADNVKNRILTDSLSQPRYDGGKYGFFTAGIKSSFMTILHENDKPGRSKWRNYLAGAKNFYRGLIPVVIRAGPTNAAALMVFEAVMRALNKEDVL